MKTINEIKKIYSLPLPELVEKAHAVHKENFKANEIQTSQLLSIKTGGCPEDCSYCPQAARYQTGVERQSLMSIEKIISHATEAKEQGATRFCMGTAWREVKDGEEFDQIIETVKEVRNIGMEVCCTLGMISYEQAKRLKDAGLYAYNHNIDTSEDYYKKIISTRGFQDRIETIKNVRKAGITVCTGGILGLGESEDDRVSFLGTLINFSPKPESITINTLVKTKGTPLENNSPVDPIDLVRTIATARIFMPQSMIRLSAGRKERTVLEQFLCFYVGANSIFYGEKLLTSPNPHISEDLEMINSLGLKTKEARV